MSEEKVSKEEKTTSRKSSKSAIIMSYVAVAFAAIMITAAALLILKLTFMHVLPMKYTAAFGIAILVFGIIIIATSRKKAVAIVMSILSLLVTGAVAYGFLTITKLDKTLNNISTDSRLEVVEMSVVVLKDDKAQTVTDISGYKVGYYDQDAASEDMKTELSANLTSDVDFKGYANPIFLADSLLKSDEEAIILNATYIDIISEIEGYEDFADKVRVLDTLHVETEAKYDASDAVPTATNSDAKADDTEEVTTEEPFKLSSGSDCFTVYISGIDTYGSVNTRSRSDVNILAVVNTNTGKIQLINTPRDYYVPLPISNGSRDKLTHAGIYGIEVSEGTIGDLYGIQIDYYLRMNFTSFVTIIDELGGIDVNSDYDFNAIIEAGNHRGGGTSYHYNKGINHLNGIQALGFARERHSFNAGDVQRGKNQMEVIKGVISKLTSKEALTNFDNILAALTDSFQTDMPTDTMYSLVRYQLENNLTWSVDTYTVTGYDATNTTFSMPGFYAYVMVPNEDTVNEAKQLIADTLGK